MKTRLRLITGLLLVLVLVLTVVYLYTNGRILPLWIKWEDRVITADVDNDSVPEILTLENKILTIETEEDPQAGSSSAPFRVLLTSSSDWRISDMAVADLDGNGDNEILLLVWKKGSFGSSHPFWVTDDKERFSEHVFVYHVNGDRLQPVWMSSALGIDVQRFFLDEDLRMHFLTPDNKETVWVWDGWGFTLLEE